MTLRHRIVRWLLADAAARRMTTELVAHEMADQLEGRVAQRAGERALRETFFGPDMQTDTGTFAGVLNDDGD